VLAWSAIPVGALAGGWAVERTGSVALVYAVIGAVVALLELAFSFGLAGHAERYLPGRPASTRRHALTASKAGRIPVDPPQSTAAAARNLRSPPFAKIKQATGSPHAAASHHSNGTQ
jgi:hypothetical protein